ncbi:putative MFS-type transporter YwoD [Alicyclobacillus contaminans]|uniref:MFS transporter n=1 Tax=Alicyclobacillus contaminans TaxID=392016 RepID=UPI00040D27C1|nr:MFS transporter [Alicyclobacillus contaminans]GMA49795.1 putative MFS-type transporter YwoD [Alicyclobacillus contaminans]
MPDDTDFGTITQQHPIRHRRWLLIAIALGVLLNPLNSSMISVALNRLEHAFQLNFTSASWLISTYYLASAIAQPVMGKLADTFGRKRVFLAGLLLVAVSSASAPFAPSFTWLIVLRLIQSFGSGAIYPAGMGIVRKYITDGQAQSLAFLAVFSSGAAAFGPSIGGLLMHWGDWPTIFWINFPFILGSFTLGVCMLPNDGRRGTGERTPLREALQQLDLEGITLFTLSIVLSLVFLLSVTDHPLWWAAGAAVLAIAAFVWRELTAHTPFINLRMFRQNPAFAWVLIQFVTVNTIFYSIFFGMPTYLQEVRHFTPQDTGLIMLCVAGFGVIIAPIAGRWVAASGSRPPLLLAGLCMTVGSSLFLVLRAHAPVWWLCVNLSILGLSNGFNNVGLQTALFQVTPQQIISAASGLFQTSRYMGTILSTLLLGVLFGNHLNTAEVHSLGGVLTLLGLCVLWMSWRIPKKRLGT